MTIGAEGSDGGATSATSGARPASMSTRRSSKPGGVGPSQAAGRPWSRCLRLVSETRTVLVKPLSGRSSRGIPSRHCQSEGTPAVGQDGMEGSGSR